MTQNLNKEKTHEVGIRRISSLVDAWWKILLIFGIICGGIYSAIVFWIKIQSTVKDNDTNKVDIQFIKEHYASKDEVKAMDSKLEDLHQEQHRQTEIETKQIEEALDWIQYEKGRQDGIQQSKK